jgi:DNA-binding LytR/AlgR family response regulator
MPTVKTRNLAVLVVEDEFLIADDIAFAFARLGIKTVGPAKTVQRARDLIEGNPHLDGAVLDINLRGELVFVLVDLLRERGVPVIFATGYDQASIPREYRDIPRYEKPLNYQKIVKALFP